MAFSSIKIIQCEQQQNKYHFCFLFQEIEQHDAVTSDIDDDDEDILANAKINLEKYMMDQTVDTEHLDELEDDLHEKLIIQEPSKTSIVVE